MSDILEKKPIEPIDGPVESQRDTSHDIGTTSDADAALAAMGYKPVRVIRSLCYSHHPDHSHLTHAFTPIGFQARVWIMVCLQLRSQYFRPVRNCNDDLLISALCRRCRLCSLVLAYCWHRRHVPCLEHIGGRLGLPNFWCDGTLHCGKREADLIYL